MKKNLSRIELIVKILYVIFIIMTSIILIDIYMEEIELIKNFNGIFLKVYLIDLVLILINLVFKVFLFLFKSNLSQKKDIFSKVIFMAIFFIFISFSKKILFKHEMANDFLIKALLFGISCSLGDIILFSKKRRVK